MCVPLGSLSSIHSTDWCQGDAAARAGEHSRGCVKPSPSDWCVLCELEKLAQQAYRDGGNGSGSSVLNPRPLVSGWQGLWHGAVHAVCSR